MRHTVLLLAGALLLASCGDHAAPETSDQTITLTFRVKTGDGVTTKPMTTVLVAARPGKPRVVDASADEAPKGSISGRHNFPPGVTASAITAYYEGLLRNAGWGDTDLRVERSTSSMYFLSSRDVSGWSLGNEVELRFQAELR